MTTVEAIQTKLIQLPPMAQEEALGAVEEIEARYKSMGDRDNEGNGGNSPGLFDRLAEIRIDGPTDLAERHDYYAHGKSEE